jgi:ribosomal protein S18 acetylase RimI-like enzyme
MIHPIVPADTPFILEIAKGTGVFKPLEIEALKEVLDDYHADKGEHRAVSYYKDDKVIGFAYWAPTAMTDRGWHLWWIAVDKKTHARGVGSELLKYVEEEIRRANGRQLLIETSSLPHYELTRRFYLKHGYEKACEQPDYYADGDHMVVFRKRLQEPEKKAAQAKGHG